MSQIKFIVIVALVALTAQSSNSASIPSSHTCSCTKEYNPICGSDDITYSNPCLFMCEKEIRSDLEIKHDGLCVPSEASLEPVDCVCTLMYAPICGSDGQTYASECQLQCAQKQKRDLQPKHDGECEEVLEDTCICPMDYSPLCGSDGQTYGNKCNFDCEKLSSKIPLEIVHDGECELQIEHLPLEADLSCLCEYLYDPVCGTDGQTYDNICELNCEKNRGVSVRVDHHGLC